MIARHLAAELGDAADQAREDDVDLGPVQILRAVAQGLRRAGLPSASPDQLTDLADELAREDL